MITEKLVHQCFRERTKTERKQLIKLLAMVSEKSFRRGFQHGYENHTEILNATDFRFMSGLDKSPEVLGSAGRVISSKERMLMETPNILSLIHI